MNQFFEFSSMQFFSVRAVKYLCNVGSFDMDVVDIYQFDELFFMG